MVNTSDERAANEPICHADLDAVIHAPKRLSIMALLNASAEIEFAYLRERLGLRDSDLSKQMSTLCDAGLVEVRKEGGGRKLKTWYAITSDGAESFARYRATLQVIVDGG